MQTMLLIISVGVLILALYANAQTRAYLWELDNLLHLWQEAHHREDDDREAD